MICLCFYKIAACEDENIMNKNNDTDSDYDNDNNFIKKKKKY